MTSMYDLNLNESGKFMEKPKRGINKSCINRV